VVRFQEGADSGVVQGLQRLAEAYGSDQVVHDGFAQFVGVLVVASEYGGEDGDRRGLLTGPRELTA
jgi:hypothetical protein